MADDQELDNVVDISARIIAANRFERHDPNIMVHYLPPDGDLVSNKAQGNLLSHLASGGPKNAIGAEDKVIDLSDRFKTPDKED